MPKLTKKTISIFIVAVVALYVVINIIPKMSGALTGTEVIEYGELRVADHVDVWTVRDETVYKAYESGIMSGQADEGTLIKKDSKVLEFKAEKQDEDSDEESEYASLKKKLSGSMVADKTGESARKGIVSYYIDGYEDNLTPETMKKVSRKDVKKLTDDPENVKRSDAMKGDPIYKIADNSNWYIMFWVDEDEADKYKTGEDVTAELPDGDLDASVEYVAKKGNNRKVILKTNNYYKSFTKARSFEADIVTTDESGLLISNSCLTKKGKKTGCYVKTTGGDYVFKQVNVLAKDDDQSLISEEEYYDEDGKAVTTVKAYDEVLKNPEDAE